MMKIKSLFLLMIIAAIGCSSTSNKQKTVITEIPAAPALYYLEDDSTGFFYMALGGSYKLSSEQSEFINSIKSVSFNLYDSANNRHSIYILEKLEDNFGKVGLSELFCLYSISLDISTFNIGSKLKVIFDCGDKYYYVDSNLKSLREVTYKNSKPLILLPYIESKKADSINFSMYAIRHHEPDDEYLPSSEDFRLTIRSPKGKLIWVSNYGSDFLTVVGTIKPQNTGGYEKYSCLWNFRNNSGDISPQGLYNAELTIPAKPNNYFTQFEFIR
ncbi:MAG: hypothetical protein QG635_1247 [Bacteroidota bacterium]|nr:hypothetical protein [Bacteroidota bacterium]